MNRNKIKFLSVSLVLSFALLFFLGTAQSARAQEEGTLYKEDINQDYKVDIADIIALMIRFVLRSTTASSQLKRTLCSRSRQSQKTAFFIRDKPCLH